MQEIASNENILNILYFYNPWWKDDKVSPNFNKEKKRFSFYEAKRAFLHDSIRRFVLLSGARRTGKTTIMYQTIADLLKNGVSSKNILFISFEHPIFKLCTIDRIIQVYRDNLSSEENIYLFFDEIQYSENWEVLLKILFDTQANIRLMATGSASPMLNDKIKTESGLGRWVVILIPTLSFFEYCELKGIERPLISNDIKPTQLYKYSQYDQVNLFNKLSYLQSHFNRYLQVGGFPELALSNDDIYAQRILREDIVDKALKRDLPAIYGIRNLADIEKVFLYLCYKSSNIIGVDTISHELNGVARQTIQKYIDQLESANLIYVSEPIDIGGKQILKTKNKIYISDAAIRSAVLMNDDFINTPEEQGTLVETAVFKHVKAFYYKDKNRIGYFRDSKTGKEIDIVVDNVSYRILIEVKYREDSQIKESDAIITCNDGKLPGLVITKNYNDFGLYTMKGKQIYRMPAFAFLYLLGFVEYNTIERQ